MSKILIIDDEVSLNKALSKVAVLSNHSVKCAFCLKEGLEVWNSFLPDIVLLDVFLPDANALQFISKLDLKGAKLVLMSAHEELNKKQVQGFLGVDLFLPKPFLNIFKSFQQITALLEK
ncbi:MAG: response regulator [Bdellovibrionaceae bacterium]|nr:response regulator [Pseudobdellovibrionaceae bacterium]